MKPPATTEYVVVTGDTLGKIAKRNNISLKALEDANPGVDSKHLKVKQKLVIPAPAKAADMTPGGGSSGGMSESDGESYTVKAGDTLSKIAHAHGVTVKALEEANNLNTTKINVGKKLKIPAKAEAPAPPPRRSGKHASCAGRSARCRRRRRLSVSPTGSASLRPRRIKPAARPDGWHF